jgi:hypothetical protein
MIFENSSKSIHRPLSPTPHQIRFPPFGKDDVFIDGAHVMLAQEKLCVLVMLQPNSSRRTLPTFRGVGGNLLAKLVDGAGVKLRLAY